MTDDERKFLEEMVVQYGTGSAHDKTEAIAEIKKRMGVQTLNEVRHLICDLMVEQAKGFPAESGIARTLLEIAERDRPKER